jgi:hypothetical protein
LFLYLPENARFLARARNDKVGYFALRHSLLRGRCKKGALVARDLIAKCQQVTPRVSNDIDDKRLIANLIEVLQ